MSAFVIAKEEKETFLVMAKKKQTKIRVWLLKYCQHDLTFIANTLNFLSLLA